RPLGQTDRMAGVVGPDPDNDRAATLHLLHGELDHAEVLVVIEGRRLACGAAHDEPVRAVLDEVVHEAHGGLLVETTGIVERRHHRGQDRAEIRGHLGDYPVLRARPLLALPTGCLVRARLLEGGAGTTGACSPGSGSAPASREARRTLRQSWSTPDSACCRDSITGIERLTCSSTDSMIGSARSTFAFRRATSSLKRLIAAVTSAARSIARGNESPTLPGATSALRSTSSPRRRSLGSGSSGTRPSLEPCSPGAALS